MEINTIDINMVIIHYLNGSATLEEKRQLLEWLKQSDSNCDNYTNTRDLWLSCNALSEGEFKVDIALERLKLRIMNEHNQQTKKKVNQSFIRWYQVVAVILLLLGIGYWLGWSNGQSKPDILARNQLITAKGNKGKFTLPDGSIVWLNSESCLSYPLQFIDGKRVVELDGGAYFEIIKDSVRPFIVRAGEINVEVLGTSFNVSAYSSHENIETALLNGSVKITGHSIDKAIILKPNDVFRYEKENDVTSVKIANAGLYADWTKDRLVFDNVRLSDIIISMEGWYNVNIECSEKFAQSTQMSFTIRQENIEEILRAMSYIVPIGYQIKENKVHITPK